MIPAPAPELPAVELPAAFPTLARCVRAYLRAEAALTLFRQTITDLPADVQRPAEQYLLAHCLETRIAMQRALATCEQLLEE